MAKQKLLSVTIHDCEVDTFRAGGKGGQKQNKTESGVRVRHVPSGAVGESREHREQLRNKKAAFERMAKTKEFQTWVRVESLRIMDKENSLEKQVDREMLNVKTEFMEDGKWVEVK